MFKRLVLFVSLLVLLCSTIFIINQTAQIVGLANTISPALARVVLVFLLIVYAILILVPIVLFVRMPKPINPPVDEGSPEYQIYLRRLGARLAANHPNLASAGALKDRASIESVLKILDVKADAIVKRAASTRFVTTAVSQNGRLDAIMVLAQQTRLIWQVAHIYNQRPALRDFVRLYANVGATVFAASELEDLNVSAQVEPIIKAAFGSVAASLVPGISSVTSIVMHSVLVGTANAFLTLRVGIICQSYCRSITAVDSRSVRRSSTVAAASMLGSIVSASAGNVIKAIAGAARKAGESTIGSAAAGIIGVGAKLNPFRTAREK